MPTAPGVISQVLAAIPAEEDAAFVAQLGERGQINSRAGSVNVTSGPLTVAAIKDLSAAIFPPEKLQALQDTGLAEFDFALPGVDGWFTATAGAHNGDCWVNIRRRRTKAPGRVQPAVSATTAAAVPAPPVPVAPAPAAVSAPIAVARAVTPPAV